MEVRCGKCNKLFRVADDKITGTGIKFPCTRCGTYVRITHEDLEQYTVSHSAVSFLDRFEPKPSPEAAEPAAMETVPQEHGSQTFDLTAQATHGHELEEKPPLFVEPEHLTPASAAKTEPAVELKPEPLMQSKPKTAPPVEPKPEPKLEPFFVPKQKAGPAPEKEAFPEPARPTPPVSSPPAPPIQTAMPKKEYARSAAPAASPTAERIARGPRPSHSGQMILVLVITLIILGLAAYGIHFYLQESPPSPSPLPGRREVPRETVSIEGLQVVNVGGSVQENGDLFITGVIQNSIEKERTSWYVVAEVYNAQGAVLSKIRLLNGKQVYSRRDYDILAGRGVNVQELKAKNIQDMGVVIPPKGMINFEMRYLQPPAGIASFVAQALPFDPVQLQKEIAEEIK